MLFLGCVLLIFLTIFIIVLVNILVSEKKANDENNKNIQTIEEEENFISRL